MTPQTSISPLNYACSHVATPQEKDRDPSYEACRAEAGEPCIWGARYDGYVDPPFHSERLEASACSSYARNLDSDLLREAVLQSGLI